MSAFPTRPMLRLVSTRVAPTQHPSPVGIDALLGETESPVAANARFLHAQRIARENAAAAELSPTDVRWLFAQETARRLEGDKQAILRPQRRRDLHALATKVGLRPFDANLVIAIVQDAARHDGGPLSTGRASGWSGAGEAGGGVSSSLSLIRRPEPEPRSVFAQMFIASTLGIMGISLLIGWLLSGLPG